MKRILCILAGAALVGFVLIAVRPGVRPLRWTIWLPHHGPATITIIRTEYRPPAVEAKPLVVGDRLEDKTPRFDPALVDRRPAGEWLVNLSDAVIALDVPMVRPDLEPELLALHPSYAAAIAAAGPRENVLPSVNMIDGKAKQFDDGLVAAIEQAAFQGKHERLPNPIGLVRKLLAAVGPTSPAAPFLAAGLTLAGEKAEPEPEPELEKAKARWIDAFEQNAFLSKPIGVFTWNPTLSAAYRFHRFFQQPFHGPDLAVPRALATVLERDPKLRDAYHRVVAFRSGLTDPPGCLALTDLFKSKNPPPGQAVAVFPPSTSRENELFTRLFPAGLPPDADLMRALIARIRSGEVDLAPRKDSGWYDHQVHALETLLLPERGDEASKLLLSRSYKLRMLEAFQALMTKRRETHAENLGLPSAAAPPLQDVVPRLRLEPCPSFYLRTARAYAFLAAFLESAVGDEALGSLHGLRESGERPMDLRTELAWMRDLFYGLTLLSAEDIGLRLALHDDEPVARDRCERIAAEWLADPKRDPDLGADTRVSVPVYHDPARGTTRIWATLGVRLTRLSARYARPPRVRPRDADGQAGDWQAVRPSQLGATYDLIPVDEFAEVELRGNCVLNRQELRAACDAGKAKAAIVSALER